ncbi:hypothetical protein BC826DRAFT_706387 [Russula brevipes]|nr:hypothetical protein BC826DRAFT_706387 [Russula brevipes]
MRKPPTFHHLPQVRGACVQHLSGCGEKTKSKWKAQKRREGILTQRDALLRSSSPLTTPQSSKTREGRGASADGAESDEPSDEQQISSEAEPTLTASVQKGTQKTRGREEDVPPIAIAGPPLRELQKQAYSPASLHHYKSRPLRHSKGRMATHDVKVPGSSRKEDVGESTRNRSRRGGQPDMRLRMSVMLEKIKRDHS